MIDIYAVVTDRIIAQLEQGSFLGRSLGLGSAATRQFLG